MSKMLPGSDELSSFLIEAQTEWHDDTTRLVLADYLEDHDDPRSEMIRISCEQAQYARGDDPWYDLENRLRNWFEKNRADWLGRSQGIDVDIERGLLQLEINAPHLASSSLAHKIRNPIREGWVQRLKIASLVEPLLAEIHNQERIGRVTCLDLTRSYLNREGYELLAQQPQICELSLRQSTSPDLMALKDLPRLQKLNVSYCYELQGDGFQALAKEGRLRHLDISGCPYLNTVIHSVSHLPELQTLNMGDYLYAGQGLAHLSECHKLRSLTARFGSQVEPTIFHSLAKLEQLESLQLNLTSPGPLANLNQITRLAHLHTLHLESYLGSAAELMPLTNLPQLRELVLTPAFNVSDEVLGLLQRLSSRLERLTMVSGQFTDQVFQAIQQITGLKVLRLDFCRNLTGAGVDALESLPNLRELSLTYSNIDRGIVSHLCKLKQLRKLNLWGCYRLPVSHLERIREALPRCEVLGPR